MNSTFDDAEAEIKNYIQISFDNLQKEVTQSAENRRTNNEFAADEAKLNGKVTAIQTGVYDQFEELKGGIFSKRPGPNASEKEKQDYRSLLQYADDGLGSLKHWISGIFSKLTDVIKSIVNWVRNGLSDIGTKIKNAFQSLADFFF
jgi:Flp pilus assembly pilin Flp